MKELKNYKNNLKKVGIKFLFFSFFILFFFKNCNSLDIYKLENYVNDYTKTLKNSEIQELNNDLKKFDQETTNQIVVLIIDTLGNKYSIEDYSLKIAEKNKIGTEKNDNGILLLIVKDDRKLRIEVGYGLESFLTDAKSSYIIRNIITTDFKKNDYYSGIKNGLSEIKKTVSNTEYLNEETQEYNKNNKNESFIEKIISIIITILVIIFFIKNPKLFLFLILSGGFNSNNKFKGGKFGGGSSGFGGFGGGFSGGGGGFGGGGSSGSW